MSILIDDATRVIVQGITGHQGMFHTKAMLDFGTRVVAGVTPGKAGTRVHDLPVYDSVVEARDAHGADASLLFVPAPYAKDAAVEAIEAGVPLLVIVTERIPFHDTLDIVTYARAQGTRVLGPNCPGIATPGKAKMGIMPNQLFRPGDVGVVSRSGTLTYEIVEAITRADMGQTTVVGIGGDPIIGTSMVEALRLLDADESTKQVVLVGEIGGTAEEEAAAYARTMDKPVLAYVAGRTAPADKRMGHAGAIITRGMGTAASKVKAFEEAGVKVAPYPIDVGDLLRAT